MGLIEIFLLAIGLSMDAFAVAVCVGLTMGKSAIKKALIVGLYFGIFQAGMPVLGFLMGRQFAYSVAAFAPWIALGMLTFLGGKMLISGLKKEDDHKPDEKHDPSLGPKKMLPLAVATSIDALAIGVTFALFHVNVVSAVSIIGLMTFVLSVVGVKIGNLFGVKFKSKAEILGGIILIAMGLKIFLGDFLGWG